MGVDKATLEFAGQPLITHSIRILQEAGLPVLLAGNRPDLKNLAETVNDLGSSRGPLGGICGALQVTSVTEAIFIPVDLPLLPSALIIAMLEIAKITGHAVVVPSVNGYSQTFPVVLNRAVLPVLRAELEAGRRGCFSAFNAAAKALEQRVHVVRTELLVQAGRLRHPDGLAAAQWFFNINSVANLRRAQAITRRRVSVRG